MKIGDIPLDGTVLLKLHRLKQTTTLPVEIQKSMPMVVVLKPIIVGDKILNVEDAELKMDFIYERQNEKPLVWKHISFGTVRVENRPHVVLTDKSDGVEYNRRTTFRMDMDVKGLLNGKEKVVVHDLSSTGISFYAPAINPKAIGDPVLLSFMGGYEEITVAGEIVRVVPVDERNMYGCTIKSNLKIDQFLSDEQRRRAFKNRGR
ncbi:MAG: PilZ domain-containing protein [Lachnospiraceae bacterium]|nr:PilZ domain-containing protein [Lachnospiraceae bacterium]